jgi:acyl-CoA synthetase (NDP forming)
MGSSSETSQGVDASLAPFYDPRSVALIGASRTPGKWGNELALRLIRGTDRRRVHLVSPRRFEIDGHTTEESLAAIEGGVELVISAVSSDDLETVVDEGLASGAKAFIGVSGGMGELGGEASVRQKALVNRIREGGARLLGPNCLGVMDTYSGFTATAWFQRPAERQGSVAVVTQSGTVGLDFERLSRRVGLGFSRFVSVGNQADVQIAELLEDLITHEPTRLVVVYCESFLSGRRLFTAAQTLVESGKPVLMLAPGGSKAAARAARSHTGSMTTQRDVVAAACKASGVQLFETTADVVDSAYFMLQTSPLSGTRVGIVADGGGYGVLTADLLDARGVQIPAFGAETQAALQKTIGVGATTMNPVDLAAAAGDPAALDRAVDVVIRSGEVDSVVVTGFVGDPDSQADAGNSTKQVIISADTAALARERGIPLVVQALFDDSPAVRDLAELPVAVYRTASSIGHVFASAMKALQPRTGVPPLADRAQPEIRPLGYFGARELLASQGIRFARSLRADASRESLLAAAHDLSYPLVLKAVDRLHKSDDGGVVLGISDELQLVRAHAELVLRIGAAEFAVEEMVDSTAGVELIVGARNDPLIGPIGLIGFGGVYAELFRDFQVLLAPVAEESAAIALQQLQGARLLSGVRGRGPLHVSGAAGGLSAVSRLIAAHPELAEIEINPLLVTPTQAIGLDARAIATSST